jgi:hypothetical protein
MQLISQKSDLCPTLKPLQFNVCTSISYNGVNKTPCSWMASFQLHTWKKENLASEDRHLRIEVKNLESIVKRIVDSQRLDHLTYCYCSKINNLKLHCHWNKTSKSLQQLVLRTSLYLWIKSTWLELIDDLSHRDFKLNNTSANISANISKYCSILMMKVNLIQSEKNWKTTKL